MLDRRPLTSLRVGVRLVAGIVTASVLAVGAAATASAEPAPTPVAPTILQYAPTGPALAAPVAAAPRTAQPASRAAATQGSTAGPAAAPDALTPAVRGTVAGSHQAPVRRPVRVPIGEQWGQLVDATIAHAIAVDKGTGTPFADSWLASGIAQRSRLGWSDPDALHYLRAALDQPNPYGLGYTYDAFQNGTLNPPTTVYAITLTQVGWVELDAWQAGVVPESDLHAIIDRLLIHPRIVVSTGIGLAYSNDPNDIRPGYSVHNVNQAAAIFLQDVLDAGITYRQDDLRTMIAGLNTFELASYNPSINGWAYRDGGPQGIQDPSHSGVGAWWAQRFYPDTIGRTNVAYVESTNYGYVLGGWVHPAVAQWDCADSQRWIGQARRYLADPMTSDFLSSAKNARMMAQAATACGSKVALGTFAPAPSRTARTTPQHEAPDAL